VAGTCFILPAFLIVLAVAVLYVRYGSTRQAEGLLYGITPVVVAIVAHALWGFLRQAVKGPFLAALGIGALVLYFLGAGELLLLFGGGLLVLAVRFVVTRRGEHGALVSPLSLPLGLLAASASFVGPLGIFVSFLKIGSVLFGSGYVLLAFLRSEFVDPGLLTNQQLLDAVAVGQVTPGPVFTTATFTGYVLAGVPGAVLATVGIFLPGFVFVALTGPIIPRLRNPRYWRASWTGLTWPRWRSWREWRGSSAELRWSSLSRRSSHSQRSSCSSRRRSTRRGWSSAGAPWDWPITPCSAELRRMPLLRTRVNKGKSKGWAMGEPTSNSGKEKELLRR
jgi:putative chromate ion transporter